MTDRSSAAFSRDYFPLTERQSLFWVDRKLSPNAPLHNVTLTLELAGCLDTARLEQAYQEAVRRLDFLRLFVDDAEPRQWLTAQPVPALRQVDLSERPGTFDAWFAEQSGQLFAFPGWLHRASLVRLAPERHVFVLVLHHIGSDGASAMHFGDYLAALYEGRQPEQAPSFREYTVAETEYRASPKHVKDAKYWRQKLHGGVRGLRFYGKSRTSRAARCARVWHDYGVENRARFDALAGQEEFQLLTPAMSRLALLSTLLFAFVHRVTENRDLVIATPLENRSARFHDTFGLLMEQTFVKVDIEDGETFRTLFAKVRTDIGRTFRHAQHCVPERNLDFVSLNLLTARPKARFGELECVARLQGVLSLPAAKLDGVEAGVKNTFGLQVHDATAGEGLRIGFDFHADTFSTEQRERMVQHFQRMLEALLADTEQRLDGVDLLAEPERQQVLQRASGPQPELAPDLLERIRSQCQRQPDKVALITPQDTLSYAQLAARVNRLARRLVELGVGPESRVAVSLRRGTDELTTLLAILTAGGAYVPLDPVQPIERLRMIIEDAKPDLLVTALGLPLADDGGEVRRIFVDDETPELERFDASPLLVAVKPDALAYILFTSGSTGRPKGVEIPRRAFSNFQQAMAREPGLSETDGLLAITTTMFDIAGLELFLPLWVGATLRIADAETILDGRRLRSMLERDRSITVLQATPATWRMLIESGWQGDKQLKMLVGGEALSRELANNLLQRGGELWNVYGPTETTVWSTLKRVTVEGEILIGRPIDHTQVYVLDSQQHLTPHGVTGELCIGGLGLARGYYGRPELTAERFIQNPHGPAGDRIYRTGDLARLHDDGDFECLGRLDHQVKIRGFRVELGEIEARLGELSSVRQAVVVLGEQRPGEPSIIAYVRPTDGADVNGRTLSQELKSRLPTYMVPSQYVRMDEFPLTPNGKIDRKALPAPAASEEANEQRTFAPPRNATERTLLEIWKKALKKDAMGVDDDFFDLGGHSILAVKIFDEIHRELRVDLPLAALFETPTVELLARRIDDVASPEATSQWTTVVPMQPKGFRPPLFCVSGIGGNPMNFKSLVAALGDDQPFYGLQHRGADGKLPPHRQVRAMAEEFVADIRKVQGHGPYYLAGYSAGGLAAYEMSHILQEQGEEVGLLILFDTFNPLLPPWSKRERFQAHLDNLRQRGWAYIPNRLLDRVQRRYREWERRARARLASRVAYKYRLDALVEAGIEAEHSYQPRPYSGDAVVLQADARLSAGEGIGYKPHESNGWRDYVKGRFEVVEIATSHLDVMGEIAAPVAAAEVRRVLAVAQARREGGPASRAASSLRAPGVVVQATDVASS